VKFKNTKTLLYKSKLEEYCASQLERHGIPFTYESQTYTLQNGFDLGDMICWEKNGKRFSPHKKVRKITYTPDFLGKGFIIETKGVRTESFNIKWKLFKHYVIAKKMKVSLYSPSNKKEIDFVIENILANVKPNARYKKVSGVKKTERLDTKNTQKPRKHGVSAEQLRNRGRRFETL